jgi:SRSO17 transposase
MAARAASDSEAQAKRFTAYVDGLAKKAGHADRSAPLKSYCTGLLLPGERKSVEPMAARLAPENVRRMHQSLHHLVADAPWSDEEVLRQVRRSVLPIIEKKSPVVCWIVDDTGFPKNGSHSVGVARQYCGQVGKQDNCRVAVSLSVATWNMSLPISFRLYLPEIWTSSPDKRRQAGIPDEIEFQTKPQIALEQIRQAVEEAVPVGIVIADAGYGADGRFRNGVSELGLEYVVGVQSTVSVWEPGKAPLAAKEWKGQGRRTSLLRRDKDHQPVSARQLALSLPAQQWQKVSWREGTKHRLKSRFAAVRVRPAHRDYWQSEANTEEWLLIEWPDKEAEPTKYWLSTMPEGTKTQELALIAKQRWLIERDYQEQKQELGLGHYEGRGWRGFHHHATLCIAAYGFLVMERSRFSPSAHVGNVGLPVPELPANFRPRGAGPGRAS